MKNVILLIGSFRRTGLCQGVGRARARGRADILSRLGVLIISPVILILLICGVISGIKREWVNMGGMLIADAFLILCSFVAFAVPDIINGICDFLSRPGN